MRRYRLSLDPTDLEQIVLEGDLFHHIVDVCRQDVGSKFELLDSKGFAHLVVVETVGKRQAQVRRLESRELPKLPRPHLILALSVPRFPVLESVLEKCVELGVAEVHLFFSSYSFVRGQGKISDNRFERWQKIILSSTQQSGRGDLMTLHKPVDLKDLLPRFNPKQGDWGLLSYEGETPRSVVDVLKSRPVSGANLDRIWFFVGSEGGFSPAEVSVLESEGILAATLGDQVLRVETACITLASILKYDVGHFGR